MKMASKYDGILKTALLKLKEDEFSNVPQEEEITYTFSKEYINKRNETISYIERSHTSPFKIALRKVAVFIVTLSVIFCSLMSVDAVRKYTLSFLYNVYRTFTEIKSETNNTRNEIEKYYTLPIELEDYYIVNKNEGKLISFVLLNNEKGNVIKFSQSVYQSYRSFNSENSTLSEVTLNNTSCLICKDENNYLCYWCFDGYFFELIYSAEIGEDFMYSIIGNLK